MKLMLSITLAFVSLIVIPSVMKFFAHDINLWANVALFMLQIPLLWPIVREFSDEEWLVDFLNPSTDPFFPFVFEFYDWGKKWVAIIAGIILIDLGYNWIGFWMVPIIIITFVVLLILNEFGKMLMMMDGDE